MLFRDSFVIIHREVLNAIRDRRALFTNYVLPMLIIPAMFLGIGFFEQLQSDQTAEEVFDVALIAAPAGFEGILDGYLNYELTEESHRQNVVTADFQRAGDDRYEVELVYDSASQRQSFAASQVEQALAQFERGLVEERLAEAGLTAADIERVSVSHNDLPEEEASGSPFLAIFVPYFLIIYIFAGSMSIGIDITAGEKDRGSLPVILVNRVARESIALGKILFLVASALLNSISSFLGLLIAFRLNAALFPDAGFGAEMSLSTPILVGMLLSLLSAALLAAAIIVLLGSAAGSAKEAGGYIMPVYLVVILVGVATMGMETVPAGWFYGIPVLNVIFVLKDVLLDQVTLSGAAFMAVSNVILTGVVVFLTARMYNSERIMKTAQS